jgi:hypothetical protein
MVTTSPEMLNMPDKRVSHDQTEETIEAKARWFQSLTLEQRMDVFCWFTDFMLATNPQIAEERRAYPPEGRVRILSTT